MFVLKNKKYERICYDKTFKGYRIDIDDGFNSFIIFNFNKEALGKDKDYIVCTYYDGTDYHGYEWVTWGGYKLPIEVKENNVIYIY